MKELLNPTAVTDCRDPLAPPQRDSPPTTGGPKGQSKEKMPTRTANLTPMRVRRASSEELDVAEDAEILDEEERGAVNGAHAESPANIIQDPIQARHWRGPRRTDRSILRQRTGKKP
ncbi:hypothetical protein MUK42_05951 [Musa troglodytarum]|uniref:Uncharacterized protein n=1 Tax=Musa troglodytarum TaxID=320322 RepID=A0A9E7KR73_9LILI|nr:hypothetical protein MUK42_05951 [Musa troglodytarum]